MVNTSVQRVGENVWRLQVPMPSMGGPATSNAYAVLDADGGVLLVDSGWDTDEAWEALRSGLDEVGPGVAGVRTVVATHLHRDHRGLAERLRQSSSAVVAMHVEDDLAQSVSRAVTPAELLRWGVPTSREEELRTALPDVPEGISVDRRLVDGDELPVPGRSAVVVHTPGHTRGSVCVLLPTERLLCTGDTLLPDVYPGLGLSGGATDCALDDYRRSLQRLEEFSDCTALPGHGSEMPDPAVRIAAIRAHHDRRTAEVGAVVAADPGASVWEIASRLSWRRGWDGLIPRYRVSALRQTGMHLRGIRREP